VIEDGAEPGRVVVLVTSPRVSPGLLSWPAWDALRSADVILVADLEPAWSQALADAGVQCRDVADVPVAQRAGLLVEATDGGRTALWFGSPDGDPGLTDALAEHLGRRAIVGRPPEVELLTGSHDVPGSRLLDVVAVMDTLRSPGGCPWDAEQTHASLLPYLLEEAHEVMEAVDLGDRDHLREELGDLLLQVAFHARVAQEDATAPFGIDDVAAGIVAKLVSRHPHVFADTDAATADEVEQSWEQLKAAEKQRTGVFEGIPVTLPALARAQKMLGRVERLRPDLAADPVTGLAGLAGLAGLDVPHSETGFAIALLDVVRAARAEGIDAEAALRSLLTIVATTVDGRRR
jgi:XTP/dITP diphosphohydrolase